MISFCIVLYLFTERSTFTKERNYNYVKCFRERTIKLDYKFCLQTAKLSNRQQVVAISLIQWQIQLSWASRQVELRCWHRGKSINFLGILDSQWWGLQAVGKDRCIEDIEHCQLNFTHMEWFFNVLLEQGAVVQRSKWKYISNITL